MDYIYPCRDKQFWPTGVHDYIVLPPHVLVQPRRRKKVRIESKLIGKVKTSVVGVNNLIIILDHTEFL